MLYKHILEGRLRPGARLRFDELRSLYEVGLSPLREALMKLAAEDLVTFEEHKGFRVAPASKSDLLDIVHIRKELEVIAIRLSIEKGDDHWEGNIIASLHELTKRPRIAPDGMLDPEWEQRHKAFHFNLGEACGSPWLLHFRSQLYDQANRYRRLAAQSPNAQRDVVSEHKEIAAAVLARDVEAAADMIRQHLDRTAEILLDEAPDGFQ